MKNPDVTIVDSHDHSSVHDADFDNGQIEQQFCNSSNNPLLTMNLESVEPPQYMWERIAKALDEQDRQQNDAPKPPFKRKGANFAKSGKVVITGFSIVVVAGIAWIIS